LRLQSAALDDPAVRELFAEIQRRVRAMALLHEQLYQSSKRVQIDFESYVRDLVNYLRRSYTRGILNVGFRVTVENVTLEMDQAMPLGLLLCELVSNALKYAFPSGADAEVGEVWIAARSEPPGNLTLIVGDNGVGLPDNVDIEDSPTMGLQLVRSFVAQLQGRLDVQRKAGTVFTVTIPERKD
jgi:two-component sensor histidine kinase